MRKYLVAISGVLLLTAAVSATPITDRQALMKDIGRSMGVIGPVLKGEKPFDAATIQAALDQLQEDAIKMDAQTMFPAGSDTGDTAASPKIWEDPAGFQADIDKFRVATADAAAAKPQDVDALRIAVKELGASCGTCHQAFRIKK